MPGVTYALTLRVAVGATWYEREMLLSVLTDKADTGPLFPVALSVTSTPYARIYKDNVFVGLVPLDGAGAEIRRIVIPVTVQSDHIAYSLTPLGGFIREPIVPVTVDPDHIVYSLIPAAGEIRLARISANWIRSIS